jgi:methylmalonyl-CoA mutase
MEKKDKTKLFENFKKISKEDWKNKVTTDLKGKAIEELSWNIEEKITITPFYHAEDLGQPKSPITGNKVSNEWEIGESFDTLDLKATNAKVILALEGGVNAPEFHVHKTLTEKDFEELYNNINPAFISSNFLIQSTASYSETFSNWNNYLKASGIPNVEINGSFTQEKSIVNEDIKIVLKQNTGNLCLFNINSDSADSPSNELTILIKKANSIINNLQGEGFSAEEVANKIQFTVSIGKDFFVEIAKIRALKVLWANLLQAYDCKPRTPVKIIAHFKSSSIKEEENQNMIAAATMALSAIIGGVDTLYVTPAGDSNDAFTRRIARNVQHLLKMESFMDKVLDPAAGSYYIETLTEELGGLAWEEFGNT